MYISLLIGAPIQAWWISPLRGPLWALMMQRGTRIMRHFESMADYPRRYFIKSGVLNLLANKEICQFEKVSDDGARSYSVRLQQVNTCFGAAIGISRSDAFSNLPHYDSWHDPARLGFVSQSGCWGLSIHHLKLYAEGTVVASTGHEKDFLRNKILKVDLDVKAGTLSFSCDDDGNILDFGSISAPFDTYGPLMFTVSGCCNDNTFQFLNWFD